MKIVSRCVALALISAAGAGLTATPVLAQKTDKPAAAKITLSKKVIPIYQAAMAAQKANDIPGMKAKIAEGEALPDLTADDTYALNSLKIAAGQSTKDYKYLAEGLKGSLASGKVPPADEIKLRKPLAQIAVQNNDYPEGINQFEKVIALDPADSESIYTLAQLYDISKAAPRAYDTYQKAIAAKTAAGGKAEEDWYRRALAVSYNGKLTAQRDAAALALVKAYPTRVNWREALNITRDSVKTDDQGILDILRLQSAANALNGEADYVGYAEAALGKGLPGEAKMIIDKGVADKMVTASKPNVAEISKLAGSKVAADKAALPGLEKESKTNPKTAMLTADAVYGYGDFAKAASLYTLAAASPTIDADTANLRLGAALARAGDKAGAATALGKVKGGFRATLAQYWMLWMAAPPVA